MNCGRQGIQAMVGDRRVLQESLFYDFRLDGFVPSDHMLRAIDRFVHLSDLRRHLGPFYGSIGRPSIDPELMIRMLLVGYCLGIRSERRLCEEVHLNLAYRWFCRLGLEGKVPDHSTFSKNRHGRFRESDAFRHVFETVVSRCIEEGLVGGEGFAVDATLIAADANKQRSIPGSQALDWSALGATRRSVQEYLDTLDKAAWGAASEVEPKFISRSDPAAQWTLDVEATRAIRQAEVGAAKTMIERTAERFGLKPERLAADSAYGSASSLNWMVEEQGIAPHVPVFDRSQRTDGTFSRDDFRFDEAANVYICAAGKTLTTTGALVNDGATLLYRGSTFDCGPCKHKDRCCPNTPARKIPRSIYERARDVARTLAGTPAFEQSKRERKRIEMLFAHLKRILRLGRLRLRGPSGARDEFLLAATAQNLRKLAKLVPTVSVDPTLA
jgi:transposase